MGEAVVTGIKNENSVLSGEFSLISLGTKNPVTSAGGQVSDDEAMEGALFSAEEKDGAWMNQRRPRGAFLATLQVLSAIPLPILRLLR